MTLAKAMADLARGADAVRVTVRRDGKVESAEVEVSGPHGGWGSLLAESVIVNAAGDSASAVLTFAGGERVTIGATEAIEEIEDLRAVIDITRQDADANRIALRAAERQVRELAAEVARLEAAADRRAPAASAPPPPPARWWQTVGAWGALFAPGPVTIDPYQVVQVEGDRGAWVRSMAGVIALAPADRLDGMKPIAAPPDAALRAADDDRELRARINRIRSAAAQAIAPEDDVSFVQDLLRGDL